MPGSEETRKPASRDQDQVPLFSFGIVADVQYCDCEHSGTRYYRSSLQKLRDALDSFAGDKVDFAVNLGDIIDRDYISYSSVFDIIDSSGLEIHHVTGNHDYSVTPRLKKRIPPLEGKREGYYSFIHNNFRFILLNGNEISTYGISGKRSVKEAEVLINKLGAEGKGNAVDWNGGIGSKQLDWLDEELRLAAGNNEKVFIFCHFPVWPENVHNLLNSELVLETLNKYSNIVTWFNGHNHMGNYGNQNMIHFVTMKGMVETESTNSYAIVDVYRNKIWIRGSGREKSQILAY